MKNQIDLLKTRVLKTLNDIKNTTYPSYSIKGKHNKELFELIPLTKTSIEDKIIITLLAEWRKKVQEWFPAQFNVTENGTKSWLQNAVIQNPDRILFMIKVKNDYIGHVGLFRFNFEKKTVDIDNIIRGINIYPGIMTSAIQTMMQWGRDELGIIKYTLSTQSDNVPAIELYKKIGFIETKRIPIKKEKIEDRTEWVEQTENIKTEKYNVYMELTNN